MPTPTNWRREGIKPLISSDEDPFFDSDVDLVRGLLREWFDGFRPPSAFSEEDISRTFEDAAGDAVRTLRRAARGRDVIP